MFFALVLLKICLSSRLLSVRKISNLLFVFALVLLLLSFFFIFEIFFVSRAPLEVLPLRIKFDTQQHFIPFSLYFNSNKEDDGDDDESDFLWV